MKQFTKTSQVRFTPVTTRSQHGDPCTAYWTIGPHKLRTRTAD